MEESKEKQLSIETGVDNGLILIKITDTGEGIPEEDLSKIFLPGFTTKPIGKGTGLGLASVKTMVESYS
jgi:signal transduction histidine kinase